MKCYTVTLDLEVPDSWNGASLMETIKRGLQNVGIKFSVYVKPLLREFPEKVATR